MFLLRSAGCVINDLADRKIDPQVARTRERPLAAGKVSPGEALFLFFGLMLIAFGLVLTMNRLTVYMAVGGAALASVYPFTKRITHLPQLVLWRRIRLGKSPWHSPPRRVKYRRSPG